MMLDGDIFNSICLVDARMKGAMIMSINCRISDGLHVGHRRLICRHHVEGGRSRGTTLLWRRPQGDVTMSFFEPLRKQRRRIDDRVLVEATPTAAIHWKPTGVPLFDRLNSLQTLQEVNSLAIELIVASLIGTYIAGKIFEYIASKVMSGLSVVMST